MTSLWALIKPEATTNLCANPSFESATTGWIAGGSNTITRDTSLAKFGVVSLKCTYQDSLDCGAYSVTLPTASTSYTYSAWVYVPSDWDGGNIKLASSTFTSAVDTVAHQYTDGTSPTGEWVYLETTVVMDTDVAGFVVFRISSAPTAGKFFYIDGVQIEEKAYVTTYCDGDQDGCEWTAGEHLSASTRSVRSWQGGRVQNFADDFEVQVNGWVGTSIPQLDTNISELGLSSGGHHQSSRYRARNWQILCQINGSSQANMHSLKKAFLAELDPRRLGDFKSRGTPVRFRYTGSSEDVYIDAFYTGGAEFSGPGGGAFTDIFPIRLSSPDPFFRTIGDKAKVLDSGDSATFNVVFRRGFGSADTGQWDVMGPISDSTVNPTFNGMAREADGTVWLGGNLTDMEGNAAYDYLITYDPVAGTYSPPYSTAPNNSVADVVVHPNGTVYITGSFTSIDGTSANRIASYNGSTWSALGTGFDAAGTRIKIGPDGLLYAGGSFTAAGGTTVRGIATWDGSSWAALGPPSSGGTVNDFDWDKSGNLYVVGSFTNWDGTAASDYIAKWDGSAWSAVTTPVFNATINCIKFDDTGNFYVGGSFTTFNSATMNYAAYFNGTTYEPLSSGFDQAVFDMEFVPETGQLWLVGSFTTAGSNTLSDRMAIWDGSSFVHTDLDLAGSSQLGTVRRLGNYIYVSGIIDSVAGTYAGLATATNNGSAVAYPVIYITRSGGTAATMDSIRNITTGAELLFNYQFLDGETLRIDLRPGRRKMVSSIYGERWKIFPTSDIAGFSLAPGDNVITSFFRTTGSPTMVIWAVWQQTQLGVD